MLKGETPKATEPKATESKATEPKATKSKATEPKAAMVPKATKSEATKPKVKATGPQGRKHCRFCRQLGSVRTCRCPNAVATRAASASVPQVQPMAAQSVADESKGDSSGARKLAKHAVDSRSQEENSSPRHSGDGDGGSGHASAADEHAIGRKRKHAGLRLSSPERQSPPVSETRARAPSAAATGERSTGERLAALESSMRELHEQVASSTRELHEQIAWSTRELYELMASNHAQQRAWLEAMGTSPAERSAQLRAEQPHYDHAARTSSSASPSSTSLSSAATSCPPWPGVAAQQGWDLALDDPE